MDQTSKAVTTGVIVYRIITVANLIFNGKLDRSSKRCLQQCGHRRISTEYELYNPT